jgi:hypothetical protein
MHDPDRMTSLVANAAVPKVLPRRDVSPKRAIVLVAASVLAIRRLAVIKISGETA